MVGWRHGRKRGGADKGKDAVNRSRKNVREKEISQQISLREGAVFTCRVSPGSPAGCHRSPCDDFAAGREI